MRGKSYTRQEEVSIRDGIFFLATLCVFDFKKRIKRPEETGKEIDCFPLDPLFSLSLNSFHSLRSPLLS